VAIVGIGSGTFEYYATTLTTRPPEGGGSIYLLICVHVGCITIQYISVKLDTVYCLVVSILTFSLTKHHAAETYWGCGGTAPRILNPGTRWRRVL